MARTRAERDAEVAGQLAAIRATAAARTGWEPWMTEIAGFGACHEEGPICPACNDKPGGCGRCGHG